MATQNKIDIVKSLTNKIRQAKSIVFADYSRLTHKQLEDLRKKLAKVEGQFVVAKNTLLKRAFTQVNQNAVEESHITGATGTLLALNDEVGPIKELINFFKTAAAGIVKGGFLGNVKLTPADVEKLASLPSRKELLGKLVGQLQAPLYGLHNALSWNTRKLVWTLEAVKNTKN